MFNDVIDETIFMLLQSQLMLDNMTKKGKKKAKIVDYDSYIEGSPTPRVELIYEDTNSVTEEEPKFKWGQIYHMLVKEVSKGRVGRPSPI